MKRTTMKLEADEKELLESVERGEWKSAGGGKRERARYSRYAKATFRKDRRLNIRLSSKDLEAIQKRALAEGLPYQTLILQPVAQVRVWTSQRALSVCRLVRMNTHDASRACTQRAPTVISNEPPSASQPAVFQPADTASGTCPLSEEQWTHVKDIFHEALELPAADAGVHPRGRVRSGLQAEGSGQKAQ